MAIEANERGLGLLTSYPILCKAVTQLDTIAVVCSNARVKNLISLNQAICERMRQNPQELGAHTLSIQNALRGE